MADNVSGIGKNLPPGSSARVSSDSRESANRPAPADAGRSADSQELTASSRLLQDISARIAQSDPVDSSRVETVRTQIADGSFSVDSDRVASGLINFERMLGSE